MNDFIYTDTVVRFPPSAHAYIRGFWERGGFYEQELLEHIARTSSGGIFVDVGASTGNHSLFFSMFCKAQKVLSFEPNKEHHKSFNEFMTLNSVDNVQLLPFALSNSTGKAEVTYVINPTTQNRTAIDDCITLDNFLALDKDKISIIKIDVEGHELKVLEGSISTLKQSNARLYIECIGESEFEDVESFLKPIGYGYTGVCFNHTPTYEFNKL